MYLALWQNLNSALFKTVPHPLIDFSTTSWVNFGHFNNNNNNNNNNGLFNRYPYKWLLPVKKLSKIFRKSSIEAAY